jgi:N-methylhydantoinase A
VARIRAEYDAEYSRFYDRPVPGSDVEIMSYAVVVATVAETGETATPVSGHAGSAPVSRRQLRDTVTGEMTDWAIYDRTSLAPGATLPGPAVIAEDETSTLVGPGWSASINRLGYIELLRGVA